MKCIKPKGEFLIRIKSDLSTCTNISYLNTKISYFKRTSMQSFVIEWYF